jgi:integrase/recombinase XerD
LSFDFVVHPIRWEHCPLVAADLHACSWLTLQSRRGLAPNTLDAYSRALERYLGFLDSRCIASLVATRGDVGLYLASFQRRLSNATIQQLLTVVRLFHAYLLEEGGAGTVR